jgi:hypothetical protein
MAGMAFGVTVEHLLGPIVSSPAVFGVVAMGAVFGGAAQAPLTAIASVMEMRQLHPHPARDAGGGHRTAHTGERAATAHRV